ncbi:UDP-N-acetylmuramoyl-tripeptide--D-alanyl-D-alanine ligase [Megasphaera paucivorans]|uniref:UDP-N-acetylmuramoyl-tripeptide--D-alanyl-D-alanine ligase n=1 Tax=Megasphaera paucivorans TaxID=349095 RepID=A0A1G9XZI2_9FIRM|nr:UDP-N-acetylmuramoyl-tripeptide--D-alanyl-D-alanine ligase [Megasphaera paucivorans]SDN01613.1 UDP-N-acetylmuramoyl-tripeptide--D-alanyl-D-alanine ligase [Megasphaera paucivorans]
MAAFTIQEVEKATEGTVSYPIQDEMFFSKVETDTRNIGPGSLFVALKGEKFDGHDFVCQARDNGATGAVVQEYREEYKKDNFAVILVANTVTAYQGLARFHRRRFDIPIVAVTGSVGKTTTRNMIASVLAQKYTVLQTEKNFNNEIGLPKTLLQLTENHGACVVEMGMRGLGQIADLAAVAEPTVGVVTNVGKSHIELLGSQANIAKAKSELVKALTENGAAILNQDDPYTAAMADLCKGKVVSFGLGNDAVIQGSRIFMDEQGVHFTCRCFDEMFDVLIPSLGEHNVYNALAAISVGRILGLSDRKMQKGLLEYQSEAMRQELIRIGSYTFINDAYNANPASMQEAVRTLAKLGKGRKIAVLGDMLELGDWAQKEHEKIGIEAAALGIDAIIALGPLAEYIASAAENAGMIEVHTVENHAAAASCLKHILQPGDTVLLKGSRGMAMEKILPYFERKSCEC